MRQSKTIMALIAAVGVVAALAVPALAAPKAPKTKMDTPALSCAAGATQVSVNIRVCAGPTTGAPAGFSLHWTTADDLALGPDGLAGTTDDGQWPPTTGVLTNGVLACGASFSGNANGSAYNLAPGQCVTVNIGDNLFDDPGASSNCASIPLVCGTDYVFRTFAHANSSLNRSDFSANQTCSTDACPEEEGDNCTFTQGYWKTHGPIPTGNNVNEWPVTSLTLGTVSYTDLELQSIFDTPAAGNGLISLAHQLIAAKLNIANGADDSAVAGAIAAADALIGGLVVPPVGTGSLPNSATSALNATLTSFNQGDIGPGHCAE